jgi:hypothetical protein
MEIAPLLGGIGKAFSMAGSTVARGLNYVLHPFDPNRNKELDEDISRRAESMYGPDKEGQKKFAEEREKKLGSLREQLAKITEKNALDQMSTEEKLAHLIEKRLELLTLLKTPIVGEDRLKRSIEEQTLLGEILGLQKGKSAKTPAMPPIQYGSLAHVGGFGMISQGLPAQKLEQLVTYTQATAKHTQLTAEEMREFRREMQFINNREEFYGGFKQL